MTAISVYIVAANAAEADSIAEGLIADRLAACVNIMGPTRSVYRWMGTVEHAEEVALIVKTRLELFDKLALKVRGLHSYETPAIVAWPIIAGDSAYLDWIVSETSDGETEPD